MAALQTFCDWQQIQVSKQCFMSDEMQCEKFKVTIGQLSIAVSGGPQKRYPQTKKQKKKHWKKDRLCCCKAGGFPPVPLVKKALAKAMHALPQIKQQHHCAKELPGPVQSAANADLAGILWFNGFGGRKKEWEIMLREHCQEQFAKVLDYFCLPCAQYITDLWQFGQIACTWNCAGHHHPL